MGKVIQTCLFSVTLTLAMLSCAGEGLADSGPESLPYRQITSAPREPYAGPAISPAYKGGSSRVVLPEDTQDTPEAPLSAAIADLAQALNWSPVLIYEYVMNHIETEWYWGCMKGAEETLRQRSGNDCDQATLLVALMRASGYPARYVRGTIEFFAGGSRSDLDKIKNLFGIDEPSEIAGYLQKAGIPYRPVISGGAISNFQVEHIWVETRVPYGNYRGAVLDSSDKTWLGLDTSIKIKDYTYNSPLDIYQEAPTLLSGIKEEYLGAPRTETPLQYLKTKLLSISGQSAESYKSSRALPAYNLGLLPSALQFVQKTITHEYPEIPAELKHKVRFTALSRGETLFEVTVDTQQLSNQRIVLAYEPASVEDQEIIDSHGGLDTTPAYLVALRPLLKLNAGRLAAGKAGLPMGAQHSLVIELISPQGTERTDTRHTAGNLSAIGLVAQQVARDQLTPLSAEEIYWREALSYIDRWNSSEEELASLLHLPVSRPFPVVATVGGVLDVSYLADLPQRVEWKGVYIDANLRTIAVTPARQKTFMELSGLQGSVLAHKLFEDDLQAESISTAKLLQIVNSQSGPLLTLTSDNAPSVLQGLSYDQEIKDDILNAVNQNLQVKLPVNALTYENWSGTGYIKENPATGESGYMLPGRLTGGLTVISPEAWSTALDNLQRPYRGDYNILTITSPGNGATVLSNTVRVTGVVLDAHAVVTVNGILATVFNNTFTAEGVPLNRGMNTLTATATDHTGKVITRTIQVKYRIPLRTSITFPFDAAELSGPSVDVEGVVSDNLATVEVNGVSASVSSEGWFVSRGVLLQPGATQLTATATNAEGEKESSVVSVNTLSSSAEPISLAITSPQSNALIPRPAVLVTGTVATQAKEVSIKVNGVLAEVYNGQFVANQVPLAEGSNAIVVHAVDTNGAVARAELTVQYNKGPYVTLTSNISSGLAPLSVYFRVSTEIPHPVVSYQLDFEGDGIVDYTGATFEEIIHDYTAEGIYQPKITVTDDRGNVYTDTIAVVLLNRAQIDALLKGKWEQMKGALANQDIEGAMKLFTRSSQEKYSTMFTLLKDQLPVIMPTFIGFNIIKAYQGIAEYEVIANENDALFSYPGIFVRTGNGIWKFKDF